VYLGYILKYIVLWHEAWTLEVCSQTRTAETSIARQRLAKHVPECYAVNENTRPFMVSGIGCHSITGVSRTTPTWTAEWNPRRRCSIFGRHKVSSVRDFRQPERERVCVFQRIKDWRWRIQSLKCYQATTSKRTLNNSFLCVIII
jgi:hypothetical protein